MTDSTNKPESSIRATATRLALQLGGYSEFPDGSDALQPRLTPPQRALICDTFGLLNGIGSGAINAGQPRIQVNLVRVVAELSQSEVSAENMGFMNALGTVLSQASSAGLTAENQSFTNRAASRIY